MRLRCFRQVVAQGRRGRALQRMGEYRFRTILLEPWSGVEAFELGVRERKERTVGASSGERNQRGTLADSQRQLLDIGPPRIDWLHAGLPKDLTVHEQAVEERIDATWAALQ